MSSHKRYFDNPYPENGQVGIVEGTIKEQILKIIDFILKNCQPTEDNGEGGVYKISIHFLIFQLIKLKLINFFLLIYLYSVSSLFDEIFVLIFII